MIPLSEIDYYAQLQNVSSETIEKDYAISWILLCLSNSIIKDDFVFYGGTAIKRIYFADHLFSEDIDLISHKSFKLDYIVENLNCLNFAKENANLVLSFNKDNIISSSDRIQMLIHYSGYEEILGAPKEIRLDFSMNMDLFWYTHKANIIKSYSDLQDSNSKLFVMTLNTILANKFGLLFDRTRNEPRDLFDIWFLLNRLKKFDFNLKQVCQVFKDKYSFPLTRTIILRNLENAYLEKNWHIRLNKQLANLPNIKEVIKDVSAKTKALFPTN